MTQVALYFSLPAAEWVPCLLRWNEDTGHFERIEGPQSFGGYWKALEASRVLGAEVPSDTRLRGERETFVWGTSSASVWFASV